MNHRVILADRNQAMCDQIRTDIEQRGGSAYSIPSDVAEGTDVDRMFSSISKNFEKIDVLINCAGIGSRIRRMHEIEPSDFEHVINVNLKGVFLCMRGGISAMLETGGGSIVNIASVGGTRSMAGGSSYGASKAGVISLTKSAAVEYAHDNIRVNAVCPGWTATPMLEEQIAMEGENLRRHMIKMVPMSRLGLPDEAAEAAYFLACGPAFCTGTILVIDGGMTA